MKVKVKIEGLIDVPAEATEEDIKDALYVQIGFGSMAADNPVEEPDWVDAEIEIDYDR